MFENIIARWKLGQSSFGYKEDKIVTHYFEEVAEKEWESVIVGNFNIRIKTKNNIVLYFWNENKYFAWGSRGNIEYPNGEEYSWDERQPNAVSMLKMKEAIDRYFINIMYKGEKVI
jgi:hypothetical protein